MREITVAESEERGTQEANLLEGIGKRSPDRQLIAQRAAWSQHTAPTKKRKVPQVGLFFVMNAKPWVEGIPWTETASHAGFRTYGVDRPDFWWRLQERGAVPSDMPYEDAPRGHVTYEDASGRFTLFADRCIIGDKELVSRIMSELGLPKNTKALPDDHYRCPQCLGHKPTPEQEEEDWDF